MENYRGFRRFFPKPRILVVSQSYPYMNSVLNNTVPSGNREISVLMTTLKQLLGPQFSSLNYKLNVALLELYILFRDINHISRNWNSLFKNSLRTA